MKREQLKTLDLSCRDVSSWVRFYNKTGTNRPWTRGKGKPLVTQAASPTSVVWQMNCYETMKIHARKSGAPKSSKPPLPWGGTDGEGGVIISNGLASLLLSLRKEEDTKLTKLDGKKFKWNVQDPIKTTLTAR